MTFLVALLYPTRTSRSVYPEPYIPAPLNVTHDVSMMTSPVPVVPVLVVLHVHVTVLMRYLVSASKNGFINLPLPISVVVPL